MTVTASGGPPSPGGDLQRWLDSQRERTNNARHALKRRLLQLQQVDRRQWGSEIEPLTAAGASPAPELKPHPQPSSSVIVDLGVVNFGISESASFPTAGLPSRPWAGIAVPGLYLGAWLTGVAGTALIAAERPAMTWLTSLSFWVTVLAGMTWIGRVFANLPINRLPRWRNRTITPALATGVLLVPLVNVVWSLMLVRWLTQLVRTASGDEKTTRLLSNGITMSLCLSMGVWVAVLGHAWAARMWELNDLVHRRTLSLAYGLIWLTLLLGFCFFRRVEKCLASKSQ